MKRLQNKVALITGAASGIGKSVAELFVLEGAKVIVTDINDKAGNELAETLGDQASYCHLDVSCEQNWKHVFNEITNNGEVLDILINNAGITGLTETAGLHDPEHIELSSWNKVHEVNLTGVALGCKYGIKLMKNAKSASIVNISSRSGLVGIPAASAYASSKAGVRNHTKSVALYCAEKNYPIRCNSIHPGAILTPMWEPMLGGTPQERATAIAQISLDIPLNRMGKPEEVAYAALFLASDESSYITGIELNIDGGILAGSSASPKQ